MALSPGGSCLGMWVSVPSLSDSCPFPLTDAYFLPCCPSPGSSLWWHLDRHRRHPPQRWQQRVRDHRGTALCFFMVRGTEGGEGWAAGTFKGSGTPRQSSSQKPGLRSQEGPWEPNPLAGQRYLLLKPLCVRGCRKSPKNRDFSLKAQSPEA